MSFDGNDNEGYSYQNDDIDVNNRNKKNRGKNNKSEGDGENYIKEILEMIIYFCIVLAVVGFIYVFIGQQVEVSGESMENTLHNENHLILEKVSYRFGDPERFDIIVFTPYKENKNMYYIKRIIGLPGETVQIKGSDIYINGEKLNEDYGKESILDAGTAKDAITLGTDEYFVLGDNRNNSKDSRYAEVGLVNRDAIIGRAWVRIWPFKEFGVLKHQ